MDVDANLYQDATETVDVDVTQDVQLILAVVSVEITVVYGLFFSLSSVADAAETHLAETIIADATIAAANKRNFEDGSGRPFCMQS